MQSIFLKNRFKRKSRLYETIFTASKYTLLAVALYMLILITKPYYQSVVHKIAASKNNLYTMLNNTNQVSILQENSNTLSKKVLEQKLLINKLTQELNDIDKKSKIEQDIKLITNKLTAFKIITMDNYQGGKFIIDGGRDKIQKGSNLFHQNILLGYVDDVFQNTSNVISIYHPKFITYVTNITGNIGGMVEYSNTTGELLLKNQPANQNINIGEMLYLQTNSFETHGLFRVATIEKVNIREDGAFVDLVLIPELDEKFPSYVLGLSSIN